MLHVCMCVCVCEVGGREGERVGVLFYLQAQVTIYWLLASSSKDYSSP